MHHSPYDQELAFYSAVQSGDLDSVSQLMTPLTNEGLGILSKNPLKNLQYHLVISIALITRFCIEGGLDQEIAYSLSDLFIQRADLCDTEQSITQLHSKMIHEFTIRMAQLPKNKAKSKPVVQCLDYIHKNYHYAITLKEIARHVNLNTSYLSSLFKKEMGQTLFQYVAQVRLEASMNMLKFSDYSYADISNYCGFSSQSHFTYCLRMYTGLTPKQYRDRYYSSNWRK
jgi:AraC-like DNA-binding protein